VDLKTVLRVGVLGAIAAVLMKLISFPLPFFPPFLKYDPSDIAVVVGSLLMGPVAGLAIAALKNVLAMLISGKFVLIGYLANFTVAAVVAIVAGTLYRPGQSLFRATVATASGVVAAALVMVPANIYLFLPPHGISGAKAATMAISLVPFNMVKMGISSLVAMSISQRLLHQPMFAAVARSKA